MRPQENPRSIAIGGSVAGASFGISKNDEAAVMAILRDSMYSDKVLAVLREYSANAWDANRSAGRGDVPIEVHLPEEDDPVLRIRDRGPGLSTADVLNVYTQYGASTKRDTNDAVGMLGIGSKSAFAYADTFTITSWHGGRRSVYIAALDPSDRGVINLVHEEDSAEDTGIEVSLATKPEDEEEFQRKARVLFRHFDPRPTINVELPALPDERVALESGTIDCTNAEGEWIAVMGCVPYRIRLNELALPDEHKCLRKMSGTVKFHIGDVQIAASREELRYTARTKTALIDKFTTLIDEYVCKALEILDSDSETWFQKRLRVQVLRELDLDLPEEYEDLGKSWVKLFDDSDVEVAVDGDKTGTGGPFRLVRNESHTNQVTVVADLRFLVDDTGNKLAGYRLGHNDYVVRGKGIKTAVDEEAVRALETLLRDRLAACKLDGAKIERLSALPWTKPWVKPSRSNANRAKHRATMFQLDASLSYYQKPYSDHWEIVTRVPEATDVYVVLEGFDTQNGGGFYSQYRDDKALAEGLGEEMPKIYGYKTTAKKPVDKAKLTGVEYSDWRVAWAQGLLTPERALLIQGTHWRDIADISGARRPDLNVVIKLLGKRHPISQIIAKSRSAAHKLRGKSLPALSTLAERCNINTEESEAGKAVSSAVAAYPLLKLASDSGDVGDKLAQLWTFDYYAHKDPKVKAEKITAWAEYIRLVDKSRVDNAKASAHDAQQKEDTNATDPVHAH